MPSVTIRIPDPLLRQIDTAAAANGRNRSSEILARLAQPETGHQPPKTAKPKGKPPNNPPAKPNKSREAAEEEKATTSTPFPKIITTSSTTLLAERLANPRSITSQCPHHYANWLTCPTCNPKRQPNA